MRIGKITENVLKRSVWKQIHNGKYKNGAAGYTDCACFETLYNSSQESKNGMFEVLSSIHTVTANLIHCAKYAVVGACNNIIAGGGKTVQIQLSIILPKDADESILRRIMRDAEDAALYYKADIAGGHTEVSNNVTKPIVSASAIGYKYEKAKALMQSKGRTSETYTNCDIILTKWIALSGTAMLAEEKAREISSKYPSFIKDAGISFGQMEYLSVEDEALVALKNGAECIHDLSSAGVFAALWEFGQMTGCGMKVDLKKIPIRQETVEITDMFDINPYLLASAGSLLIAAKDGERIVRALTDEGIPATIIGKLTKGNDRIITNEDETRFLDLPQSDEILKILAD